MKTTTGEALSTDRFSPHVVRFSATANGESVLEHSETECGPIGVVLDLCPDGHKATGVVGGCREMALLLGVVCVVRSNRVQTDAELLAYINGLLADAGSPIVLETMEDLKQECDGLSVAIAAAMSVACSVKYPVYPPMGAKVRRGEVH